MARASTITHTNRIKGLLAALDKSSGRQQAFAEKTGDLWDKFADTLRELSLGVWFEQEYEDQTGKKKRRVYQKAPSIDAMLAVVKIGGPEAQANVLLAYMKAMIYSQEIDAGASKAKVAQLLSQARLNNENADVFSKMLIDDELYTNTVKAIGTYAIGQLQAVPYTQMEEILAGGQDAYDKFHERFAQNVIDRLESLLDAGREIGASKMLGMKVEDE